MWKWSTIKTFPRKPTVTSPCLNCTKCCLRYSTCDWNKRESTNSIICYHDTKGFISQKSVSKRLTGVHMCILMHVNNLINNLIRSLFIEFSLNGWGSILNGFIAPLESSQNKKKNVRKKKNDGSHNWMSSFPRWCHQGSLFELCKPALVQQK